MLSKKITAALVAVAVLFATPTYAHAFSLSFQWGELKRCTSGRPNRVTNPVFKLSKVPKGTVKLKFRMVDLDVPNYNHGGGTIKYTGKNTIAAGAFKYKSPCPPNGRHKYQWTVTAIDKKGKKIGAAKAVRKYP